uniref:protein acetyllysine N-acetyltransferase n=1 Tax=uncultured delta proteobacterium TaxID=34034 RepID=Q2YZT2_9DELT|nr:hypothetical protein [uncultured delta proteobacterium]
MPDDLKQIAKQMIKSKYVIAMTGAGISVESGIPDFRSPGGLWSRFDPFEYAHIDAFKRDPAKVWKMLLEIDEVLNQAKPNRAHYALAKLEAAGILKAIITQNIDNMHQRAGSKNVIEFHGNAETLTCTKCKKKFTREEITMESIPPLCECKGVIRPDVVFFGETIPAHATRMAGKEVEKCAMILVIGTSADVAPASRLPIKAKEGGAIIVEINLRETRLITPIADFRITDKAGDGLMKLVNEVDEILNTHDSIY